ncbi:flavin reductase family protein [Mesorhizobium sp. 1M-11]|uniref:flavin reductase family protein n=1 Tax=Mesorhizobium sp. 1M-11 TaxID=1529006 RepID=UPI0006C74015|nr:flavin reductase family protein [Mesorhizobium sp. 1M-11]
MKNLAVENESFWPAFSERSAAVEEHFRIAMRGVASTVMLITARDRTGKFHGMAATTFISVSMDPATCLISVNRTASIHPTLLEEKNFCVNIMHQQNLPSMPAYTKPEFRGDRFQEGGWEIGANGAPFQTHAQANVFCELMSVRSVGTHDLIIGRVVDVINSGSMDPLAHYDAQYRRAI